MSRRNMAGDAATGRVEGVLDGDVVVDHHGADGDALGVGQLGRRLEVEHVAGVVLHDRQHPGAAVRRLEGGRHLVGGR